MSLATIGSTFANVALPRQFLYIVIYIITLTILAAFMVGILLISGLYAMYFGLTHYGLDPAISAIAVMGLTFVLAATFIGVAILQMRRLRVFPHRLMTQHSPGLLHISGLVEAFMAGFSNRNIRP